MGKVGGTISQALEMQVCVVVGLRAVEAVRRFCMETNRRLEARRPEGQEAVSVV